MPIRVEINGIDKPVYFPDDYTPDRIKFAIENDILPRIKAAEPSMLDKAADFSRSLQRQAGLTVRAGVKGLSALPNMVLDPAAKAVGLTPPSEAQARTMTSMGLPEPQGKTEGIVQDVTGAMAGQGLVMKVADLVKSGSPVVMQIMELLKSQPQSQIIGAGGASAGAEIAKESGAGPVGQTVAALGGGLVAPVSADAAIQAAKATTRGVRSAIDPFTKAGQERVVGQTLRKAATNPSEAMERMGAAGEVVPGSKPTAAQAARDEGLFIAERGLTSANPEAGKQFSRRASEQNTARTVLLGAMAGDEATLAAAKAAREETTSAAREAALSSAKGPVDFAPVLQRLEAVAKSPEGGRVESERALSWLSNRVAKYQEEGRTDARNAYELQKDIGDLIGGKISDDKGAIRLAGGLANQVKAALTEQIEAAAPGFKKYLSDYSTQSKEIGQTEALQGLRAKVTNAGTDAATGENLLSAAKLSNALRNPDSRAELKKVLKPEQFKAVESISADLDRAALSASSGKAAGSNTTQNLSTAYVLGAAIGGRAADNAVVRNLARPLTWLNKLNEAQLQELLTDAMLNPGIAKSLMGKATTSRVESLGFELLQRSRAKGMGAAIGGAQGRTEEEPMQ